MDSIALHNLIHDSALLQQTPEDALKSVVHQYPWYALPYVLLAKKAHLEKDTSYEYWLAAAAARVPDRNVLMQLMQQEQIIAVTAPMPSNRNNGEDAQENAEKEEDMIVEEQPESTNGAEQDEPVFEYAPYEMELQKAILDLEKSGNGAALPNFPAEHEKETPARVEMHIDGVHSFSDWIHLLTGESKVQLVAFSSARRPLNVAGNGRLGQPETGEDSDVSDDFTEWEAKELARRSSQLGEGVISETLAAIFAEQGKPEKAIEIYKQLGLKYPEKISYFAGLILDLNKK